MSPEKPLVSVTIPAYNHESFIRQAIDSVMDQSYRNIALTVIDDGSTDQTPDRIKESCHQYSGRIQVVSQKNQGLVRTLNKGIGLSEGKYWCQLASDDLMDSRNIKKKVDFLENNPDVDAVSSDAFALEGGQTVRRMIPDKVKPEPLAVKHPGDIFDAKMFFPSLLFRKSVFDRIGKFDESMRYYEDIEMKLRLLLRCRVAYIDEPLLTWRSHSSNTSRQLVLRRKEKIIAYEKIFSLPEMQNRESLKRKVLGDAYYKYAKFLIKKGQADQEHPVSWYLYRALSRQPFRPKLYYYLIKGSLQGR